MNHITHEAPPALAAAGALRRLRTVAVGAFVRAGVLPFLLLAALAVFGSLSGEFLTLSNLTTLLRQSVYLILVSLGQMLALVTGGFDLSVGTTVAITSVVSASVMAALGAGADPAWGAIAAGAAVGIAAGLAVGLVNAFGVAFGGVSPFIMTLGVQSIGLGLALTLTGGVPVAGLPAAFGDWLGFGVLLGVPVPVLVMAVAVAVLYVVMAHTALGSYFLAVGGNAKAAALSGVNTKKVLMAAYVICALFASVSGLLLTARVGSGEANLGGSIALESIAACVIAGVSLRGGIGRVDSVVLGAIFIGVVQNGMNLTGVRSYLQMVVLGGLLILAVVADRIRHRLSQHAAQ